MNKKKNIMTVLAVMGFAAVLMLVLSFLINPSTGRILRYLALAEMIGIVITLILYNLRPDWFKERNAGYYEDKQNGPIE